MLLNGSKGYNSSYQLLLLIIILFSNFNFKTLGKGHIDERDTTIQIFDKFLVLSYSENESLSKDNYFLYHAAAACILISFKLHDSKSPMNAVYIIFIAYLKTLYNYKYSVNFRLNLILKNC